MPKEESNVSKGRTRRTYQELGTTGLRQNRGYIDEEFLTELRGRRGIQTYTEMRHNDPTVGSILFAIESIIKQADWYIEAASDSPLDMEAKVFVESAMHDMSHTWEDFISEVLTFLPYGYSYFETVYKLRAGKQKAKSFQSKYSDGRVGWRKFGFRSQDSLDRWEIDDNGGIRGFWQIDPNKASKPVLIPMRKSLLFRTTTEKDNPEGRSILRNAFRPWFFKKNIEVIEAIGIERDLAGLPTLTPPEDFDLLDPNHASVVEYAKEILTGVRRDEFEGILNIPGWEFELLASSGKRQFDTTEIINRYDKRIAMTVLSQFVMLGMERVGSFALSKDLSDMFKMAVEGLVARIEAVFTRYAIRALLDLNPHFAALEEYPKLKATRINVPALDDLGRYVFAMSRQDLLDSTGDMELADELRRVARLPLSTSSKNRTVGRDPKDDTQPEVEGPPGGAAAGFSDPKKKKAEPETKEEKEE